MKKRRLIVRSSILAVITAVLAYTFYTNFIADKSVVQVGNKAINFALMNLDGERIELKDLEGKGVFLNFWGTYCPPCEKEMPIMEEMYQKYKDEGIEILAVNVNESELVVERFAERLQLTFPILIDKDEVVMDAYGISPLPTTVLIDKDGYVVKEPFFGGMDEERVRSFMELIKP